MIIGVPKEIEPYFQGYAKKQHDFQTSHVCISKIDLNSLEAKCWILNRGHQSDVGCHGMPRFRRQRRRYPTSTSRIALPVRIWSIGRDPKGIRSTWGWMTWYWRTPPHTWCVHNSPHTNPHRCWAVPKMDPGWPIVEIISESPGQTQVGGLNPSAKY